MWSSDLNVFLVSCGFQTTSAGRSSENAGRGYLVLGSFTSLMMPFSHFMMKSPLVTRCVSSTLRKTRGSLTPEKVTAMASQSPAGRLKEMVLSFSLRGAMLGLSRPTAGALMISKESREIFLRPSFLLLYA